MSTQRLGQETLLAAEGWPGLELEDMDQADTQALQDRLIYCGHYQSVFTGTEQGKFVLADLVQQYLVAERVATPGDDLLAVGIRQGHQDVVHKILRLIEIARTGGAPT